VGEVEDFQRDFLPGSSRLSAHFMTEIAEPNNTLWSTTDPVSLFAARGRSTGTEEVTKTLLLVAS
jgi:hypothetical protein